MTELIKNRNESIINKRNESIIKKKEEWIKLYNHYNNIKNTYNLISSDIFKQISFDRYRFGYLTYLGPNGLNRIPSTTPGTHGKILRDILSDNLLKTDWTPSTATYEDKLDELLIDMGSSIDVELIDDENKLCNPNLNITICLDERPKINKERLTLMFTIDGIVPNINSISYSINL